MSREPDLDLDAILEEFRLEESQPPQPVEKPRTVRSGDESAILRSAQKAEEGTLLYEKRSARPAVPAPRLAEEPAPRPAPRQEGRAPAAPAEKAPVRRTGTPQARRTEAPAPAARRKPGQGVGFALMFLVLLLLAAMLAGLLRWTALTEEASAPQEPEPLRLELGESLERRLDESASTTR